MSAPTQSTSKNELTRVKIQWKNIHSGDGIKFTRGMIIEINSKMFKSLSGCSRVVDDVDIDAIKLVDDKTALTHEISSKEIRVGQDIIKVPCLNEVN